MRSALQRYTLIYNENWELVGHLIYNQRKSLNYNERISLVLFGEHDTDWYFGEAEGSD